MYCQNLFMLVKIADVLQQIAEILSALQPAANTKLHAKIRAVPCQGKSFFIILGGDDKVANTS